MQSQLDRFWYIFPNKEVKVGDSWVKNSDLSGQMPGKYNSTYTVSEIEGDLVTLDEDTKVSIEEANALADQVRRLLKHPAMEPSILHEFHFGGYAKYNAELIAFMNELYQRSGIPTDIVYTAKLFFATRALIQQNAIPHNSKVLLIHSGGLQGNSSLDKSLLLFNDEAGQ